MGFLNSVAFGCAIALGLVLCGLVLILFKNPILAKIGARNIPRRPAQSVFIVIGLTLSTTIFVTALSIGDSLNHSIRKQVIDAYGLIDQVASPSFLTELLGVSGGRETGVEPSEDSGEIEELIDGLAEGDVATILGFLEDGLPGISEDRYHRLREEALQEPLIDGLAGAIFMPTAIRNLSSGQGEPLGVVFAVDSSYESEFGLHSIEGQNLEIETLQPGLGPVFVSGKEAFVEMQEFLGDVVAGAGIQGMTGRDVVLGIATSLILLSEFDGATFTLNDLAVDVGILDDLGLDTSFFKNAGIEILSLETLGVDEILMDALGIDPDAPIEVAPIESLGIELPTLDNLFAAFNLNTISRQISDGLSPMGLQVRQGDVYLSELGALQLDAEPGDLLEIHIGPIPVPYRVRAIVKESGPLGPILPVVVMDMAEAQRLFFMSDRINAILVSNAGDAHIGLKHTEEVNQILRALSFRGSQLNAAKEVLLRPAVAEVIEERWLDAEVPFELDEEMPSFLAEFFADFVAGITGTQDFQEHVGLLRDYVKKKTDLSEVAEQDAVAERDLRLSLGNIAVRDWLLHLPLAAGDKEDLRDSFRGLEDFQVLTPLSKQLALQGSEVAGVAFGSVFWVSGTFSIMSGALLIFLIFVMLAAERRRELGIARAIGMQRGHLVKMFVTEGLLYDLAASFLGLGLGLFASYGMLSLVTGLFAGLGQRIGMFDQLFGLQWSVAPASIVISYCLGVLVTGAVVTVSSWRVSRTNIVAAIRNLPEEARAKPVRLIWRWGRPLIGVFLIWVGANKWLYYSMGNTPTSLQFDQSLVLLGGVYLLHLGLLQTSFQSAQRGQALHALFGLGLLAIWALHWQLGSGYFYWEPLMDFGRTGLAIDQSPSDYFASMVFTGPAVLLGSTLAIMGCSGFLARGFVRICGNLRVLAPAVNLSIAYPLSQRFRTGTAMLLIGMVITTVTVMTMIIAGTENIATPRSEDTAGFDLVVAPGLLSVFDPVLDLSEEAQVRADFPTADLAVLGSVASLVAQAKQVGSNEEAISYTVDLAGIDKGYATQAATTYPLVQRAEGYETDASVWQALGEREDVAVVDSWLLQSLYRDQFKDGDESTGIEFQMHVDGEPTFISGDVNAESLPLDPGVILSLGNTQGFSIKTVSKGGLGTWTESQELDTQEDTPEPITVQVIGEFKGEDLAGGTVKVNQSVLAELNGKPVVPDKHYALVAEGADVGTTARALERSLLSSAMNVTMFEERFVAGQTMAKNILRLFRGFFALGLVVGLAGLAVISTRSVVERRPQIGMLRALGYQPWAVALVFVMEASFISLSGILMSYPNILFLMSDEHRYDVLGYAGNDVVRTPRLDALAESGTIFTNAYTPSPICIPGRQAIMSGQLPRTCGVEKFGQDLTPGYGTFARRFGQYFYHTVAAGNLHHTGQNQMQGWNQRLGSTPSEKAGLACPGVSGKQLRSSIVSQLRLPAVCPVTL